MKISAAIITFNEADRIEKAVKSVDWADEVIVVDSGSDDATREIAGAAGARVVEQEWPGFGLQKQFAVSLCQNEWVFCLDADEVVSPPLRQEIVGLFASADGPSADGYRIPRLTYYMDRPVRHGGWYPDAQLRLFNRKKGGWSDAIIHESVKMAPGAVVGKLRSDIIHRGGLEPLKHQRMIGERYAPLAAEQMFSEGRRSGRFRVITAGFVTFFRTYILMGGWLDGFAGYCIARNAAQHDFLKHYLLWKMAGRSGRK